MRKAGFWSQILIAAQIGALAASCKTVPSKSGSQTQQASNSGAFVKTNGTSFELNGQPFAFQGTNFYRLALTDRSYSEGEIGDIFKKYADEGIRVVRMWGFSCETRPEWERDGIHRGGGTRVPMLNYKGEMQEEAFVQLDRVLAQADAKGIKVILPLVNFEHEYCGMEWWNYVYGDKKESKQGFYCNAKVINKFKSYVQTVLERRNTITGVSYKNDPAIFAIEMANEPHTEDNYETSGQVDPSCKGIANGKSGEVVHHWLSDMSSFIRGIDSNHMLSTGEEGYKTSGDTSKHAWLHNGMKGVDFERNVQLPHISFATVHLYPDNSAIPQSDFDSWYARAVIKDRADIAHKYGKPIVLEETGFGEENNDNTPYMAKIKATGYAKDRPKWINKMYEEAFKSGYAGTMIWQVVPKNGQGSPYDDDLFTFSFSDPDMQAIRAQVARLGGKAGSPAPAFSPDEVPWCNDDSTDTDQNGKRDGWGFENSRSCRVRP